MDDATAVCPGHAGSTIWWVDRLGYIVEIRFDSHPPIYIHSICSFTPTFGMDKIDGEFAQDAEEYVLHEVLGYESKRLKDFPASEDIPVDRYLRTRGYSK